MHELERDLTLDRDRLLAQIHRTHAAFTEQAHDPERTDECRKERCVRAVVMAAATGAIRRRRATGFEANAGDHRAVAGRQIRRNVRRPGMTLTGIQGKGTRGNRLLAR